MSWFKKKTEPVTEGEASRDKTMMDAVNASIDAADDERYKQMERIRSELRERIVLLQRDAELVLRENNKA